MGTDRHKIDRFKDIFPAKCSNLLLVSKCRSMWQLKCLVPQKAAMPLYSGTQFFYCIPVNQKMARQILQQVVERGWNLVPKLPAVPSVIMNRILTSLNLEFKGCLTYSMSSPLYTNLLITEHYYADSGQWSSRFMHSVNSVWKSMKQTSHFL